MALKSIHFLTKILKNKKMLRYFLGQLLTKIQISIFYSFKYRGSLILSYVPKGLSLESSLIIEENVEFSDKLTSIGKGTYIGSGTVIGNCDRIGKYCSISKSVKIGMSNHPLNFVSTSPRFYLSKYGKVPENLFNHSIIDGAIIEDDVLISSNVVIMEGLKIGRGSVVGAGAIVTKDVDPYSIVAGVPAKLIRYGFSKEKIKKLLKLNFDDDNDILNQLNL